MNPVALLDEARESYTTFREESRLARSRGKQKGYLRREGDTWKLTYREYKKNPDTGDWDKEYRPTVDVGPGSLTLKQATAAAKPYLERANRTAEKPSLNMLVTDFIDRHFWPAIERKGSTHHYRYLIETFVRPGLGLKQLCDVGPSDCETIINRAQKKYSPATLRHVRNAMRAMFNHADRLELYDRKNPTRGIELPEVVSEKRGTYTVEQLGRVLVLLESPVYEMALLGAAVSLGPSELTGLRVKHVNLTAGIVEMDGEVLAPFSLAIREGWYDGKRTRLKAEARRRDLGIPPDLAERIAAVIAGNERQDPEAPVFQSRAGTPLHCANIERRHFKKLEQHLGFPVTWYAFRRASSTLAALVGAEMQDRSLIMGHSNSRMTAYYDIQSVERRREIPTKIMEQVRESEAAAKEAGKLVEMGRKAG